MAQADFAELESKHRTLLVRQRAVLTKLVARASETLEQVTRRLRVLEEEYGFIRTHIFWVRDQEPIGPDDTHTGRPRAEKSGQGADEAGPGGEPGAVGPAFDRIFDCGGGRHCSAPGTFPAATATASQDLQGPAAQPFAQR